MVVVVVSDLVVVVGHLVVCDVVVADVGLVVSKSATTR